MTQNERQVALPTGTSRAAGVPQVEEVPDLECHGIGWRLKSVGFLLFAAAVIGIITVIGTVFDVLQALRNPGRWRDVLRRGRPPELPFHEWYLDVSDQDGL
jgi:hypothetical protein